MLAGVCAGLGRYFDLSPAIYRLAFVVLALAGGTGILLYIAAWLVIPDEGRETSVAEDALRDHRNRPGVAVAVGLFALAFIIAIGHVSFWPHTGSVWIAALLVGGGLIWWEVAGRRAPAVSAAAGPVATATVAAPAPPPAPLAGRSLFGPVLGLLIVTAGILGLLAVLDVPLFDPRIALGGAVLLVGVAVAVSAFLHSPFAGLAGLGILLLLAFVLSIAIRVPLHGGIGTRVYEPASITRFDETYKRGIGDLRVDLRDTSFSSGVHHVKAQLGIGELIVQVPDDVNLVVHGKAQGGQVTIFGDVQSGWDVDTTVRDDSAGSDHTLVVDAEVGFGDVRVERR
jgi:phage shock protein PspC (stress-responsive transcriptional regulator)